MKKNQLYRAGLGIFLTSILFACSGGTNYIGELKKSTSEQSAEETYTITFDKNNDEATGTMSTKTNENGAKVTLPAITFTREGFSFSKWNTKPDGSGVSYTDGSDVELSANMTLYAIWEYQFHESVTKLPAGTNGTAGTSQTYVYFGDFPNTIKPVSVTVNESKTKTQGAFTYYLGSDFYWYAKCIENSLVANKYSDGSATGSESKYFRVNPIKWRVLTDNYSGQKLLLAENILTGNIKYYDNNTNRTIGGSIVYPNNYEYSRIRAYLNGIAYQTDVALNIEFIGKGFLQNAFTSVAQALIETVQIDNNAESTNPAEDAMFWNGGINQYASDTPTSDKIFLLSEKEVTTSSYGFTAHDYIGFVSSVRRRMASDWAIANHAYTAGRLGCWLLRSPDSDNSLRVRNVGTGDGLYDGIANVNESSCGIVPALAISF